MMVSILTGLVLHDGSSWSQLIRGSDGHKWCQCSGGFGVNVGWLVDAWYCWLTIPLQLKQDLDLNG